MWTPMIYSSNCQRFPTQGTLRRHKNVWTHSQFLDNLTAAQELIPPQRICPSQIPPHIFRPFTEHKCAMALQLKDH